MNQQQQKIEQLNARIKAGVAAHLIAGGCVYVTEDSAPRVLMDLEHWRELGRPMTAEGRAEVAAEDAESAHILRAAELLGFDKPHQCGNGDGERGRIVVYDLGKAEADELPRLRSERDELLASLKELAADLVKHATYGLNEREVAMLRRAENAIAKAERR
jgi:hypothetical protein